ncbi:chromatin remodeling protein, putative [Plasmodium relictum]|uniref:Chromatin remodeling protein, putative n=1 Tax=Plasmodium relictum TaxID=85471 RepID=A0A1J1HE04_PLARL|nr:chromatin remodeling protein, putative [Plasmodium relictum]CRH03773.1 chromatin remodeling protein, putative [Plasmodium relictum]
MVVIDKILKRLFDLKSRLLVFIQMTRMIDILENYCRMKKYEYCRINYNTNNEVVDAQIQEFNNNKNIYILLLSTKYGGLKINLHIADIVILFDFDWNFQVDLQSMSRAHIIENGNKIELGIKKELNEYLLFESKDKYIDTSINKGK